MGVEIILLSISIKVKVQARIDPGTPRSAFRLVTDCATWPHQANQVKTPKNVASDQDLHCLLM